jgi:hypothetical protein
VISLGQHNFWYYVNSVQVTEFEPLLYSTRFGTDPDRFLPHMQAAGFPPDGRRDEYPDWPAQNVPTLLAMLTLALGIRLSREVAMGSAPDPGA